MKRRDLLMTGGAALAALSLGAAARARAGSSVLAATGDEPFALPPLPYDYNALEPIISEETMRFHYDKHHAGYTRNLNKAANTQSSLKQLSAAAIVTNLGAVSADLREAVRNNGGGHVNHSIFWETMAPPGQGGGGEPLGELASAIGEEFGNFASFQEQFEKAGASQFGSGWAWLAFDPAAKKLVVMGMPNQDSPYMRGFYPVLGNDVWEHAYYLTYRNRRTEYLKQWWQLVNWTEVGRRYTTALSWSPARV